MIDQDLQRAVNEIRKLATEINHMAKGITIMPAGPWHPWYAWKPVKTIGGQRVWLKQIYRRRQKKLFRRYEGHDYATDFDLLKENDQ